jgi:putative CocE/NonD family hydrolase
VTKIRGSTNAQSIPERGGCTRGSGGRVRVAALALGLTAAVTLGAAVHAQPSDRALVRPAPYEVGDPVYGGVDHTSRHLIMRDGVKIAVDLYLPEDLGQGERIPAILWQTRYWRAWKLRWPFRLFTDPTQERVPEFVTRGYAWVSVDARGSGASFGHRIHPWSEDETRDGAEIVDWILAQPWSNGRVGSFGTSYAGTTAEFLVVNQHPAVKAVAPRFSLFDAYTDIAYPGGVPLAWFTEQWGIANSALDRNQLPPHVSAIFGWWIDYVVDGVRPVDGSEGEALLEAALRDHAANWDVHRTAQQVTFRDDVNENGNTVDVFSPHAYADRVDASGTAIYSWSGWFDGGYQHSAIKRDLTLTGSGNRLIIGPWTHGGRHQVRGGRSIPTEFDDVAELLKFFDHHLKGRATGLKDEARVHYYTMVEGTWKAAARWPPPAEVVRFYLGEDAALQTGRPESADGSDRYLVDYSHGTGDASRWNSLMGWPVNYPDRAEADRKLLVYDSPPLTRDLEVTGHPVVTLYVTSSASDGVFIVYLEDVDEKGRVQYVTEGLLRGLHRKLSDRTPPHATVVPHRSFERADGRPLVPGEVTELMFDLLPTSYLFRQGHSIRIALAGADRDHFALIPSDGPPTWTVLRDAAHPSHVALPVPPGERMGGE